MAKKENQPVAANLPENTPENTAGNDGEQDSVPQIEAYLDLLCSELGTLPAERRAEIRREVRQHLQMLLARDFANEPEAIGAALKRFGDAHSVGRAMARRVRGDNLRRWLRQGSWQQRLVLMGFLLLGGFGVSICIEFCYLMQWGHNLWAWTIIGPLVPVLIGAAWGLHEDNRWGYIVMASILVIFLPVLQVPGQYVQADMDQVGSIDLSGLIRFTFWMLGVWNVCAARGLARLWRQAVRGESWMKAA